MSVILSSQQLHEIENVSDSIVFLKKGEMIYSGEVSKIGEKRENNEFEIQTDLDVSVLMKFGDNIKIRESGKTAHVIVPLEYSAEDFLEAVIKENGKVLYFRNISSSTRRLFND